MKSKPGFEYQIVSMCAEDWLAVEKIYRQGIATENATFETESPGWESWNANHLLHSRLIARDRHGVLGWAALSPVSTRRVYAGVADLSIYIADAARGKGIGKSLLNALVDESEHNGIWTLQAGIFPENTTSLALHKSSGFREVGRRERIGQMKGLWRDVILLERRSRVAGK